VTLNRRAILALIPARRYDSVSVQPVGAVSHRVV